MTNPNPPGMPDETDRILLWSMKFIAFLLLAFWVMSGWIPALVTISSGIIWFLAWPHLRSCKHSVVGASASPSRCPKCSNQLMRDEAKRAKEEAVQLLRLDRANKAREIRHAERRRKVLQNLRLPEYIKKMDPFQFEKVVVGAFKARGYEARTTRSTGDHGIDGFLSKGGKKFLLQCKRVQHRIGEPVLRDFYGAMIHEAADGGILVTTGGVSPSAREWAKGKPIEIIELQKLLNILREAYPDEKVLPETFSLTKMPPGHCDKCGELMRRRPLRRGAYILECRRCWFSKFEYSA